MKKLIMAIAAVMLLSACGKEEVSPQTVTFALDSNPSTGFSWQVEQSEELFEVKTEFTGSESEEPIDGAGGVETITLIPLKAGKTDVTLTYARPWEGGEQSDQLVYSFELDKYMQIKMSNAYSLSAEAPLATPTPEIR